MFLINDKPITTDALINAVLNRESGATYYLDGQGGGVVAVPPDDTNSSKDLRKYQFSADFFLIPKISEERLLHELKEYVMAFSSSAVPDRETLILAARKKADLKFSDIEALVISSDEDKIGWDCWLDYVGLELAATWLEEIGGEERWEFDSDCALCALFQNPEATPGDHLEAFATQNRINKK